MQVHGTASFCASFLLAALSAPTQFSAGQYNKTIEIGMQAPAFVNLPGVDGKSHSLADVKVDADAPPASLLKSR